MGEKQCVMNRRNLLAYSLRTLFVVTTSSAFFLGWLRTRVTAANRQRDLVQQIERLGGHVGYRHEWDDKTNRVSKNGMPGPAMLRNFFGDHFFLTPSLILFSEFQGTDEDLEPIRHLKTVTHVGIVDSPNVRDGVIDWLIQLPKLNDLSLYGTNVGSEAILRLSSLRELTGICVSHTLVDPIDLSRLQKVFADCTIYLDNTEPRVSMSDILAIIDDA